MLHRLQPDDKKALGFVAVLRKHIAVDRDRLLHAAAWAWSRRWRIGGLALAAAAIWFLGPRLLLGPVVSAEPVVKADFVQTVVASGHVEAPFRVNVGSQITGVVADVPVAEGQTVKAGDLLVVLDDQEAKAAVTLAEGAVAQSEARMRQLKELTLPAAEEALKQAQATLVNAQDAYDRAATLEAKGAGTRATLSDAIKALDVARAQVRSSEYQVYTNRPGGSDYVMAETLLNQAHSSLASAQSRLGYTRIAAPRDGVLISRSVEKGNVVQPSNVLMALSPFLDTQLVVLIDEKNLGLIRVGQTAIASADAYPKESFPADVFYINPGVDLQRASVQVKLRVANPPGYLRQDMTVSVDVETARHPGALIVSSAMVRGLGTDKPWVMVLRSRRAQAQPVKVGLVTGAKAEILAGVSDGELVVAPTAQVRAGGKARGRVESGAQP